jgi:hypothetical protein
MTVEAEAPELTPTVSSSSYVLLEDADTTTLCDLLLCMEWVLLVLAALQIPFLLPTKILK